MRERLLSVARTVYHRGRQVLRPSGVAKQFRSPTTDERELLERIERDGYAVIPQFLSSPECRTLLDAVEGVFTEYADQLWQSDDGADVRAYAANEVSQEIASYCNNPKLRALAERYLDLEQIPFFTLANRVRPTPGNLGSGGGWHRDSAAEHQFKSLLYLTDVGPENGPFQFVRRSHRVRTMVRAIAAGCAQYGQHRFTDAEFDDICAATATQPTALTGPAGTLIVADTSGIHRGMPITRGERYVLTNYFYSVPQIDAFRRQDKFVKYFVGRAA